ncbi:MAG: phosphatase PAP2 family protein [Cytophagales bacterium]|nr:phosphatase PAP2 family protein [Cytophagales bacterium]
MLEKLEQLDQQLFLFLNSLHNPCWDKIMYWVTEDTFFWIPFYILLIVLIARIFKWQTIYILMAIAVVITLCDQFSSTLIKPWVQRLRPCHNPNIQHLVHIVDDCGGMYGFISSHAANTFGLSMFLWLLLKSRYQFTGLLFFWAALVSYSRIYVGVHYPADIILGALSGIVFAWGIYQLYTYLLVLCNKYQKG